MFFKPIFIAPTAFTIYCEDTNPEAYDRRFRLLTAGQEYFSNYGLFSVYGLKPGTVYELKISTSTGEEIMGTVCTQEESYLLDVTCFGALGDGTTDDTTALQAAISSCPPYGRVFIPSGTYCFQNLHLKSGIYLELAKGAILSTISGPAQIQPFSNESFAESGASKLTSGKTIDKKSLITGSNLTEVVIYGEGIVHGDGLYKSYICKNEESYTVFKPGLIYFDRCHKIILQGLTLKDSYSWTIYSWQSKQLRLIDLKIINLTNASDTNGIILDSCCETEIAGTDFQMKKDCIRIMCTGKSDSPSSNISIHRCQIIKSRTGIVIGDNMSPDIASLTIEHCLIEHADHAVYFKTDSTHGKKAVLNEIALFDIKMNNVRAPIVFYALPFNRTESMYDGQYYTGSLRSDETPLQINSVLLFRIRCSNCQEVGIYFFGSPERKIGSINMENVSIRFSEEVLSMDSLRFPGIEPAFRKGIFLRNASFVCLKNVTVDGIDGTPVDIDQIDSWNVIIDA